ncbi:MAG: hypothetical protein JWP52_1853 [Rhizobacter sp.]|nr:hypothetical protein [Rhizobacter sp.]
MTNRLHCCLTVVATVAFALLPGMPISLATAFGAIAVELGRSFVATGLSQVGWLPTSEAGRAPSF